LPVKIPAIHIFVVDKNVEVKITAEFILQEFKSYKTQIKLKELHKTIIINKDVIIMLLYIFFNLRNKILKKKK